MFFLVLHEEEFSSSAITSSAFSQVGILSSPSQTSKWYLLVPERYWQLTRVWLALQFDNLNLVLPTIFVLFIRGLGSFPFPLEL